MLIRRLALLSLLILSVAGLAACGSGASDESQVEGAIETAAASNDPADCKELLTQSFMEQTDKSKGSEAVESCEEEASQDEGVEKAIVSKVKVEGSKATADAALTGSPFDGQQVEIALVKDGDQWKLDQITRFTAFNPAKVTAFFTRELSKPSSETSKARANCVIDSVERASKVKLEEILLSPSPKGFEELVGSCFS